MQESWETFQANQNVDGSSCPGIYSGGSPWVTHSVIAAITGLTIYVLQALPGPPSILVPTPEELENGSIQMVERWGIIPVPTRVSFVQSDGDIRNDVLGRP